MKRPRYWVALAWAWGVALAAALIGLDLGGTKGAVRAVVFVFGAGLLGLAAFVLVGALRARHPNEDWSVVIGYVVLRVGAGVSAIWLAFGGGQVAAYALGAFLLSVPVWGTVMRRRRGIS
jgi:hypothetical protein